VIRYQPVIASGSLGADLVESDARYFEAAAKIERLSSGTLCVLPALEHTPGGCVIVRVDPDAVEPDPRAWVEAAARAAAGVGGRLRVYLPGPVPGLERELARAGARRREELGFVAGDPPAGNPEVELSPVISAADWREKLALHRALDRAPDGHDVAPEDLVELERRKAAAGYMRCFLIRHRGRGRGAVSAAPAGTVLRLKNLFVCPGWRRRGIASAAVARLAELAARTDQRLGLFAVAASPGERMYRKLGLREVVRIAEWSAP
jgi:GNAT superfamily N-acetyltransferase